MLHCPKWMDCSFRGSGLVQACFNSFIWKLRTSDKNESMTDGLSHNKDITSNINKRLGILLQAVFFFCLCPPCHVFSFNQFATFALLLYPTNIFWNISPCLFICPSIRPSFCLFLFFVNSSWTDESIQMKCYTVLT